MSDQYRDKCVKRQKKNRGKDDPIRVSFYDKDGQLIDDVTRKEANCIASKNPPQLFYFQDADGFRRELLIADVNKLTVNDAVTPSVPACPSNPQLCGPPKVRFFGGGGFGAMANAIVSPNSSSVIGFDIVNPGFNYLSPPNAYLDDECGNGSGGSLLVQTRPYGTGIGTTAIVGVGTTGAGAGGAAGIGTGVGAAGGTGTGTGGAGTGNGKGGLEVKNIVITAPGDGYLSAPNGSLGGNGRIWADVGEGYVEKNDGTLYPVPSGILPSDLQPGDTFIPINPLPQLEPPIVPLQQQLPISYPVVLELEEVYVYDPGFGYVPGDTITTENGAILEPVINPRGEIESVRVINPGIGFVDTPILNINSNTGYNAQLIPVLKPIPLDQLSQLNREIPPGTQIINVVDCVGKIPPKTEFDKVPR